MSALPRLDGPTMGHVEEPEVEAGAWWSPRVEEAPRLWVTFEFLAKAEEASMWLMLLSLTCSTAVGITSPDSPWNC